MKALGGLVILILLAGSALAYNGSPDGAAHVRVVSEDVNSRTYTFRCIDEPATGQIRDWFIRPDNGIDGDEPNIAEFLDRPADQDLTFTFPQSTFYHVGCNIAYDNGVLLRGDLHLDLRNDTHSWNPQIVPVNGSGLTATWQCDTQSGSLGSWQVLDAKTHNITGMGTSRQLTYTVPYPGIFDVFCSADGNRVPMPTEFFSSGRPYFPDRHGVFLDGSTVPPNSTPPTCMPSNGGVETCDGKDNNCNGQFDENNVCAPPNSTCYNSVQSIPANCTGASITADTWNGGRTITCGTTTIAAWDKTGFFEMYKQAGGSGIQVCIGTTCIKDGGYAKSTNFPICIGTTNSSNSTNSTNSTCTPTNGGVEICDGKDNNCNGQVDENNVCAPPNSTNTTCYNSVQSVPASCTGASITADTWDGGRHITCGTTIVNAWNKPSNTAPSYFEMYKQAGGNSIRVCLGSTCISDNGYAKSSIYPICTGTNSSNSTNSTNSTCTPSNGGVEICDGKDNNCNGQIDENNVCAPTSTNVSVSIAQWYPQGRNYVFKCASSGFTPTSYDWSFGDGNAQYGMTTSDVYHTYTSAGNYNVTCTAKNSVTSGTGSLQVSVQ